GREQAVERPSLDSETFDQGLGSGGGELLAGMRSQSFAQQLGEPLQAAFDLGDLRRHAGSVRELAKTIDLAASGRLQLRQLSSNLVIVAFAAGRIEQRRAHALRIVGKLQGVSEHRRGHVSKHRDVGADTLDEEKAGCAANGDQKRQPKKCQNQFRAYLEAVEKPTAQPGHGRPPPLMIDEQFGAKERRGMAAPFLVFSARSRSAFQAGGKPEPDCWPCRRRKPARWTYPR